LIKLFQAAERAVHRSLKIRHGENILHHYDANVDRVTIRAKRRMIAKNGRFVI